MKEKTKPIRSQLIEFLAGQEKKFEFDIDCEPAQRIRFIYSIIFPGSKKIRFYLRFFIARLAQYLDYSPLKCLLYSSIGMQIGKGVFISPDVILDPHFPQLIEIEDYVILGWGAHLFTHEFSGAKYRLGRIHIGAGAVIGGFTMIRGGVRIGPNAQVASTCIVYKDVPENYFLDSVVLLNKALLEVYKEDLHA
jgi:acetyltransferase-like isoleucine patch superfamily enzyme